MKKFLLCIMLAAAASTAHAEIDTGTVGSAWLKLSLADNFPIVPITYMKSNSPNAWVHFESGKKYSVHVTRGLLKILNSEEEIAGILAHEMGHVKLGHYDKGVKRNAGWTLLGLVLGQAGGLAQAAGTLGMNLAEKGFSRGQEVEADDYGTELLKRAGYNPMGLYNAMKAFLDHKYITQPNGFNSHPPTMRRLQHLQKKAKEVNGN